jgi:hypothetical protein
VPETRQTNDGGDEQLLSSSGHGAHPAAFVINSLKSRAAGRAMLERRPKSEFEFGLGDSPRPILFRSSKVQRFEIATRPENFPLASPESRAAARAMLKRPRGSREVHNSCHGCAHR